MIQIGSIIPNASETENVKPGNSWDLIGSTPPARTSKV